jgi:hydrogenase nickel incorporation protein HypA/HybF
MHEMAIAEGILAVVLDAAQHHKVNTVQVRIGSLHAVVPDSLRFSFQLLAEGTDAANAVLEIDDVPAAFRCQKCNEEGRLEGPSFHCHACGSSEIAIVSGQELTVKSVERQDGTVLVRSAADHDVMTNTLHEHVANEHRPRSD